MVERQQSHVYVLDEGLAMSRFQGIHARGCRVPAVLLNRPKVPPVSNAPH